MPASIRRFTGVGRPGWLTVRSQTPARSRQSCSSSAGDVGPERGDQRRPAAERGQVHRRVRGAAGRGDPPPQGEHRRGRLPAEPVRVGEPPLVEHRVPDHQHRPSEPALHDGGEPALFRCCCCHARRIPRAPRSNLPRRRWWPGPRAGMARAGSCGGGRWCSVATAGGNQGAVHGTNPRRRKSIDMATTSLQGKRIAFLATDGVEEVEYTEPREAVEKAGADGRTGVAAARHDPGLQPPRQEQHVRRRRDGRRRRRRRATTRWCSPAASPTPTCCAPTRTRSRFVRAFFDAGKPVGVICHGPWTLIEAGWCGAGRITSWPSLRTDLTNAGANWVDERGVTSTTAWSAAATRTTSRLQREDRGGVRRGCAPRPARAAALRGRRAAVGPPASGSSPPMTPPDAHGHPAASACPGCRRLPTPVSPGAAGVQYRQSSARGGGPG